METTSSEPFVNESHSLLLDEIKGLLINTSRAAASAQRDIKINGINQRKHDINPIANFYYHFNNLFFLVRDLISDSELRKGINQWLNVEFVNSPDRTKVINSFNRGLYLFNQLDEYLFQIGIKDTNKTTTTRFPFEYYMNVIKENAKNE